MLNGSGRHARLQILRELRWKKGQKDYVVMEGANSIQ